MSPPSHSTTNKHPYLTPTSHDVNFDEWEGDMKSRVFWNCVMNETILVQELHLPPSGLARLEESVPIPKFIGFETATFVQPRPASSFEPDDSLFQYHFLAQVAHRIILTRIRHSLYFYCTSPPLFTLASSPVYLVPDLT